MTWKPFNRRSPAESDPQLVQAAGARVNFLALAAAIVAGGCLPGWSYSNSVTRGESSAGTAAQPARMYFTTPTDTRDMWVRAAVAWDGSGYPTSFQFSWSDDDEASYQDLTDLYGNSTLTIAYDGSHNVTAMTWS